MSFIWERRAEMRAHDCIVRCDRCREWKGQTVMDDAVECLGEKQIEDAVAANYCYERRGTEVYCRKCLADGVAA